MTGRRVRMAILAISLAAIAPVAPPVSALGDGVGVQPVVIPFELATSHVIVQVTVNKSRPLSFLLDSGADRALIRMDTARELGLKLQGHVNTGGAGPNKQPGSFVRDAKWSLVGLTGFSQAITFALPLPELPSTLGRPIDGIIGGEFINKFVLELDYQAKQLRLHKADSFAYHGPGEAVPIQFVDNTQPVVTATVTPIGGKPIERRFLFDIGAGSGLTLHSPFVIEQNLLASAGNTIRAIGSGGTGGRTIGHLGRVASLRIGSFELSQPIAMFSQDRAGSFANPTLAGNIGAQIARRFRVFFDYQRRRLIFEPASTFNEPFDRAFTGFALRAVGNDFRTFRVVEVLADSPATEAGINEGDVISAIDDIPADRLTLTAIVEMFEKPVRHVLTIRRADRSITVTLTPARLI